MKKSKLNILKCTPRYLWHAIDYLLLSWSKKVNNGGTAIIRIGGIGDVMLSIKLLSGLKSSDKKITIICDDRFSFMHFILKEYSDNIFYYNSKKFRLNIIYRAIILRRLYSYGFDEVIQAGISRKQGGADVQAWACQSRKTVGFYPRPWNTCEISISNKWFTKLIDGQFNIKHELDRMDLIAKETGNNIGYYRSNKTQLREDIFSVFIGASSPVREWDIRNFIEVAEQLHGKTMLTPVFIGEDKDIKEGLSKIKYKFIDMVGKTSFEDMCNIIAKSKFIITNESGPMHVGVYFDIPTIAIVSGGEYNSYCKYPEPYNEKILALSMMDSSCFNCGWNCIYKKNDGKPFPCLSGTTASYVTEAAMNWQPIKELVLRDEV